ALRCFGHTFQGGRLRRRVRLTACVNHASQIRLSDKQRKYYGQAEVGRSITDEVAKTRQVEFLFEHLVDRACYVNLDVRQRQTVQPKTGERITFHQLPYPGTDCFLYGVAAGKARRRAVTDQSLAARPVNTEWQIG